MKNGMRKWERTWVIYNGKQSQVEEEKQRKVCVHCKGTAKYGKKKEGEQEMEPTHQPSALDAHNFVSEKRCLFFNL